MKSIIMKWMVYFSAFLLSFSTIHIHIQTLFSPVYMCIGPTKYPWKCGDYMQYKNPTLSRFFVFNNFIIIFSRYDIMFSYYDIGFSCYDDIYDTFDIHFGNLDASFDIAFNRFDKVFYMNFDRFITCFSVVCMIWIWFVFHFDIFTCISQLLTVSNQVYAASFVGSFYSFDLLVDNVVSMLTVCTKFNPETPEDPIIWVWNPGFRLPMVCCTSCH